MPAGLLETVPMPVPSLLTARGYKRMVKVAVTSLMESMVTVQVPIPLQAPLQPLKSEVHDHALRVTTVVAGKDQEHVVPQ